MANDKHENSATQSLDALLRIVADPDAHQDKVREFIERERAALQAEQRSKDAAIALHVSTADARAAVDRERVALDTTRRQQLAEFDDIRSTLDQQAEANRLRTEELNREQRRLESRHAQVTRAAERLVELGAAANEVLKSFR